MHAGASWYEGATVREIELLRGHENFVYDVAFHPNGEQVASAAWDGTRLYVGGGGSIVDGTFCFENLDALNPATGGVIWRACVRGDRRA